MSEDDGAHFEYPTAMIAVVCVTKYLLSQFENIRETLP